MIYLYTLGIAWAAFMMGYTIARVLMEKEIREIAQEQTQEHISALTDGGNRETS